MFLSHTHAFVQAQRDYRLERSNARFLKVTTRRLARQRSRAAAATAPACPANDAPAWSVRSA